MNDYLFYRKHIKVTALQLHYSRWLHRHGLFFTWCSWSFSCWSSWPTRATGSSRASWTPRSPWFSWTLRCGSSRTSWTSRPSWSPRSSRLARWLYWLCWSCWSTWSSRSSRSTRSTRSSWTSWTSWSTRWFCDWCCRLSCWRPSRST